MTGPGGAYNRLMPIYEATVEVRFAARHSVRLPGGAMEQPHEHDWRATATFRAEGLGEDGFVIDFLAVEAALREIVAGLAGKDLNDLVGGPAGGASAERVAEYLARALERRLGRQVHCVRVTEAPGCTAAFYPRGAG